jgi:hypothetical protein
MNKQRAIAKLTGYSLVLMALVAGFSFGFAFPKFFDVTQLDLAKQSLIENLGHYKLMLLGILMVLLLDLLVSWTLLQYFKNDNKKLAWLSFIFRIIYTVLFCIASFYLTKNLEQSIDSALVIDNYQSFETIWGIGLIIFGIHLLFIGMLMKLHKLIPKILWYLTIIAGAAYILVHILKVFFPQLKELTNTLNIVLALPMALGELGLAVWLIVKGGTIKDMEIPNR